MNMEIQQPMLTKQQLRWQSLRPFNIVILCSFIFFFLIGIAQSYTLFDSPPTFSTSIIIPLIILLLCTVTLHGVLNKKDLLAQRVAPIMSIAMTLFISINSHYQEQTHLNNFLYFVLLLPLFYSYLFSYNTLYLVINNVLLSICYIFASIFGDTDALVFLFNSLFLLTLCYLTIYTQLRNNKCGIQSLTEDNEKTAILTQRSSHYLNRIIHDIRQPLSSLSLHSNLLENNLSGTRHAKLATNIKLSSEELERWLSSLLDLARLDSHAISASISQFTLASVLLPTIKKYQYQASIRGIQLTSRLPDLTIKSDHRLLTEIVETLLSNAIVHGSQTKGADILLNVRRNDGQALLQVWNQGKEIEPSILNNLFDEVAQAENPLHNKSKGIGLGLAIAQRKALLIGTKIEVATKETGSRFALILDTVQNPQKHIDLNKLSNHPVDYKILLIDDDIGILNALNMLLDNWGYSVDCASTAEEGLQKYNKNKCDLVISDYRLPNQKTGIDVIKAIKSEDNIPAILLTGEAEPAKLKEVQESAMTIDYKILNKPVKPASLRFLLRQLLK